MKKIIKSTILTIMITILVSCGKPYDQTITIESLGNQMKYNVVEIKSKKNTRLQIVFKNNANLDIMKHNVVVLKSSKNIDEIGKAALTAKDNLPTHPDIIAASAMVGPGETTEFIVQLPNQAGTYPYICTYPGHYQVMQGKIIVE